MGWRSLVLGDICTATQGIQIPKSKQKNVPEPSYRRYLYISDFKHDKKLKYVEDCYPKKVVTTDDIIVSNTGSQGEVYKGIDGILSNNLFKVAIDKELVHKDFLYLFLQSPCFINFQAERTLGTTQPHMGHKNFLATPISLPSISEQKRIVAILDQAFSDIDKARALTEQNLKNARELFESYLQQVFNERGEEWTHTYVGKLVEADVLDKPLDGNHGEIHPKAADYVEAGIPFVMASDIKQGMIDTEGCKFISRAQADSLRKGFAKDGDVLLSHKATIGETAILRTDLDYVVLTPQVTYYRVLDQKELSREYVYWYFNSPRFLKELREYAGAGSTRAYIGITKQLKLKFSYPSRLEQDRIVNQLKVLRDEVKKVEPLYIKKLNALEELKKSLLQKAFSGELTKDNQEAA